MKTLLYNGQVITVNKNDDIEEAILFEENKILFVGKNKEAKRLVDNNTEMYDLKGRAVLPGFIDCHIHMAVADAEIHNQIDVSKKAGVASVSDLLNKIADAARETELGEWIIGSGYNHEGLLEKRHIFIDELDNVAPDNPVFIIHTSGHISIVNTKALELATEKGLDLKMEEVVKDKNGKPTGLLQETAHFVMLEKSPVLPEDEKLIEGIESFCKSLAKRGITSAHDAGGFGTATFRTLQKAKERGVLTSRTDTMIWTLFGKQEQIATAKTAVKGGFYSGFGDELLKIGPIKIMVDGSAVGGTCATTKPLMHIESATPTTFTQSELDEIFIEGHRRGFQLTAHAVGDAAIGMVLNSYEKAMEKYPRKDCRHRIEHCFLCTPELMDRIKALGIIPIPNPGFLSVWGGVFDKYYGDRIENIIPLKSFEEKGIITPFGSDAMVIEEFEPLFGIAAAMERCDLKYGKIIGESQRISFLHSLRCYTYFGAYASFEENKKGSLEVGKLADIVVLTDDIIGKTPDEIRRIKVEKTYLGGRLIIE